jgi:hypothetical protein
MKNKKKSGFFIGIIVAFMLLISLVSFTVPAVDPVIDKILQQLNNWLTTYQPEKVYLQTDKPYYSAGDDIWFKAYITIGSKHRLSALSGSINVELIDGQDSVKQWIKLPVSNGAAWGDFKLADTLHEGSYRIRAYTNWMRNAGPDYYFDKVITIGNAATNTVFTSINYAYTIVGGQKKVTATISYTDFNGEPYAAKPVNYRVRFGNKFIAKGKGVTNNKGSVAIDFANPAPGSFNKGSIITDINLADKVIITKTIVVSAVSGMADVQFFPESGNLVNGIRSKVAFKAIGTNGLGLDIKGLITDNDNKTVSEFTSHHLGMGIFALTPESGKTYKATITYADGSENIFNLPAALNSGYVLSINNADPDNIGLKVTASSDLLNNPIYIVAQSGGQVCYVANNKAAGNAFGAIIPKGKFPSGIVQFTLFSVTGDPLNERIAFIQHPDELLKLNISTAKTTSAPREKVKIDLDIQNNSGKPAMGSFSAAVIDESKIQGNEADETTILSHTLLTSDLRGYIEQPNYYFNNSNETTQADLDILMLTQGYRRFEWKPLLAGTITSPQYKPEKLITISGNVKTFGGKPVPNAKIILFGTVAQSLFVLDTLADAQGHFIFNNLVMKDSVRFSVQARTAKNRKSVELTLDKNGDEDRITNNKYLSAINFNIDKTLPDYLKANKKLYDEQLKYGLANHILKEVTIREKKKPLVEHSDNLNGAGNADQVITSDVLDKQACSTIVQCLQNLVHGVRFVKSIDGRDIAITAYGGVMMVLWDNVPIDNLNDIDPFNVRSVEVLKSIGYTSIYGSRGGGGVLVITSKNGQERKNSAYYQYAPGIISYSPKGYYVSRQFYSPQYYDPKVNKSLADLRSTIYWQPNVITDKTGHTSFEYYNAGSPGTYRVIVEGIDVDGNLGHALYRYKVE